MDCVLGYNIFDLIFKDAKDTASDSTENCHFDHPETGVPGLNFCH